LLIEVDVFMDDWPNLTGDQFASDINEIFIDQDDFMFLMGLAVLLKFGAQLLKMIPHTT